MDKLEEFLKQDQEAMESRQYKRREKEIAEVNNIIKEVEKSIKKERNIFKDKLKELGVNIIEKEEETSSVLFDEDIL